MKIKFFAIKDTEINKYFDSKRGRSVEYFSKWVDSPEKARKYSQKHHAERSIDELPGIFEDRRIEIVKYEGEVT